MTTHRILVEASSEGNRLDAFISEKIEDVTRTMAAKLIDEGNVSIEGYSKKVKSSLKLKAGYEVLVNVPEPEPLEAYPEDIPLEILYEDSSVIVVNKPKGMVVHPDNTHKSGTIVNALLYHCKDLSGIGGVMRPGIVHRIDMNTTGSVIACKNDKAHESIALQLKEHSLTRRYIAIVEGNLKDDEGVIDAPIGRSEKDRKKMAINRRNGKRAVTHYKVLERFKDYTYVELRLETGRTHQIRVHMASINHPLLGDDVYGHESKRFKLNGQCLHARILGFVHPETGEYIETEAPIPDYFGQILTVLRGH